MLIVKIVIARASGQLQQNRGFQTQQTHNEVTPVITVRTRSRHQRGRRFKAPLLPELLFVIVAAKKKGINIFIKDFPSDRLSTVQ